ncbi:MAG: hypothetical protein HFE90_09565 [Firmicutes bacterium]|nr:hypothetical protein [Bacillota bacterium]
MFIIEFTQKTENVLTRNEIKMVACGDSFSDERVYYYQYKNSFFYGKELGYEYYGSNGFASGAPVQWIFYDLDGNIIESGENGAGNGLSDEEKAEIELREKEKFLRQKADMKILDIKAEDRSEYGRVFSISINDYIDSYNGYYWNKYQKRYFPPASYWNYASNESTDGLNYEMNYYHFTEDEKIWTLPTISVHTLKNGENIKQIVLDFDDHSYSEEMYAKYEEMCFYALKVFFPDLEDGEIIKLYKDINNLAYENIFPQEKGYNSDAVPCALYHKNGIGVYPYFAVGERVRFCIIPATNEIINEFETAGSKIYDIN